MPLTILAVDDDPAIRLAIGDYLDACGYSVITAENGREALQKVEELQPHLLITDVTMPQLDGYELVKTVRKKPAFRLLPVVFLTARNQTEERIRAYQLGCDLYLPKPFELSELGAVVRNLLERSQMIQAQLLSSGWQAMASSLSGHSSSQEATDLPVHPAKSESFVNLTDREQEVLQLLADGLSNAQIGDQLHLSPRTVEKYVSSLLRKTETSNRAELVHFVMANHWIG